MSDAQKLYECHGHLMMDGADFQCARRRHSECVDISAVKENLAALKAAGVTYFRDGGDACGVAAVARVLAPDWGIEYVTPVFAIHKRGHYGAIVGRSFSDLDAYCALVTEAKAAGCDFIKLMLSGIITFKRYGELSCPGLAPEEIRELVRIAHAEGFAVMAHVNGAETVRAAIAAGVDSIEHGYFMDDTAIEMLAGSDSIWVPTIAATAAFLGRAGFDETIAAQTVERQKHSVRRAAELGATIACGSDAGAVGVLHGVGAAREYKLLQAAGMTAEQIHVGNEAIRRKFRAKGESCK